MDFYGKILFSKRKNIHVKAGTCVHADNISARVNAITEKNKAFAYVRMYRNGILADRNREFLSDIKDVRVPKDTMKHRLENTGNGEWVITFSAQHFIWMAVMDSDDDIQYGDNAFDLWPGEQKSVSVKCAKKPELEIRNINMFIP